jgi:hypothetical protein
MQYMQLFGGFWESSFRAVHLPNICALWNCPYIQLTCVCNHSKKVGYMVCCQQSMNHFDDCQFQKNARDFVKDEVLHKIVSDMHSELLVMTTRKQFEDRCLVQTFAHKSAPSLKLEITTLLLRYQPAVCSLFWESNPWTIVILDVLCVISVMLESCCSQFYDSTLSVSSFWMGDQVWLATLTA